jgi:transcriptional regulator with XRE-family HTH domain
MEHSSIMKAAMRFRLSLHTPWRVRELRGSGGLSLDGLAGRCGVCRSMISLTERGDSSPTAVGLETLAVGLKVSLTALFATSRPRAGPLSRRADQLPWRNPVSGCLRRNVSPSGYDSPIRVVEVAFFARCRCGPRDRAAPLPPVPAGPGAGGHIELTVGEHKHRRKAGDCLAKQIDHPLSPHDPARMPARHAVVPCSEAGPWR